jgi:hypothetical protein
MKKYLVILALCCVAFVSYAGDVRISAKSTATTTTSATESNWWDDFCDWVESVF